MPEAVKKKYDLEDRTLQFAKDVRKFVQKIPKNLQNTEDGRQLIRSSGSIGANYIEANETIGEKDFLMRIKISRKEAKESAFWLKLLNIGKELETEQHRLIQEPTELMLILSAIMRKSS